MICSVCAIGLHYLILKFLSVNLFLWGHELANSFLLFSVHKSFLQIIKNFSLRHRLHFLLILSYGLQVASTFHCTRNGFLASFRVHMYFDSSVSFLLFACRNEVMWFLYLSLKFVASPTYDSFVASVITDSHIYICVYLYTYIYSIQDSLQADLESKLQSIKSSYRKTDYKSIWKLQVVR